MISHSSCLVNQAAAGVQVIAAAVPGFTHSLLGFFLGLKAAGTFKFTDGVGDLTGPISLIKDAPPVITSPTDYALAETHENSPLNLVTTGGGATGIVLYCTMRT